MASRASSTASAGVRARSVSVVGGGGLLDPKEEYRRVPTEVLYAMCQHAHERIALDWKTQFLLAVLAGSFIAFGAALSTFLSVGESKGFGNFMAAVGFATGFFMTLSTGAALFTEINTILPVFLLLGARVRLTAQSRADAGPATSSGGDIESQPQQQRKHRGKTSPASSLSEMLSKQDVLGTLRYWAIVYLGNVCGSLLVGGLLAASDIFHHQHDVMTRLEDIVYIKTDYYGASGWFTVLVSAICGNWLVGCAAFLATSARTLPGKLVGVFFPVLAFVSLGVQHSPASMGYFSVAFLNPRFHATVALDDASSSTYVSPAKAILFNIIPASIGNLIGGAVLVGSLFFYVFLHNDKRVLDAIENLTAPNRPLFGSQDYGDDVRDHPHPNLLLEDDERVRRPGRSTDMDGPNADVAPTITAPDRTDTKMECGGRDNTTRQNSSACTLATRIEAKYR